MAAIRESVMVDFVRTPFGSGSKKRGGGWFRDTRSDDLGMIALHELLKRTKVGPALIDDFIIGTPDQSGEQANVGRFMALSAGLPYEVPAQTVDRACCSSMAGAHFGVMAIELGNADIIVAGGIESISRSSIPVITSDTDFDELIKEYAGRGLPNPKLFQMVDPSATMGMGLTGENLAEMFDIPKEDQDQWALRSNLRAAAAQREGRFKHEIVPVEGKLPDGTVIPVDYDQDVRADATIEKIRSLPPAYKPGGVINAANSSKFSDGAAMGMFMSKEKAKEVGLKPMVTVRSIAWVGVDPKIMGYGATLAAKKALQRAGLSVDDIDLWETNEAFAAVPLVQIKEMGIDPEKVNVNGGACCIGHAVGASGIRMVGTLAHEMNRRGSRYGLAAICGGMGQGTAMVVEREDYWDGHCAFLS